MTDQQPAVLVLDRSGLLAGPVRHAAGLLDVAAEVVVSGGLDIPGRLTEPGRTLVVVAGPSWTGSAPRLRRLAAVRRQAPAASLLLAVDRRPDASLRDIVQAGADDLLPLPLDEAVLAAVLARALRIAGRRAAALRPATPPATGRIVTVTSPTGGAGKTLLATNLALFLARSTGERVVLVDLDLQFGEVCTALRLRPETTIVDAAAILQAGATDADEALGELLLAHPEGFSVLAAPPDPVDAERISAADVDLVLGALSRIADHVVVDTPAGLPPHALAALGLSDSVVVLGTPGRPSLGNLDRFLRSLTARIPATTEVSLVLNMAPAGGEPDLADFAGCFPQGFLAVLPHDREATRSINFGVPLMSAAAPAATTSRLTRALTQMLPKLLPGGDRAPVLPAPAGWSRPETAPAPVAEAEAEPVMFPAAVTTPTGPEVRSEGVSGLAAPRGQTAQASARQRAETACPPPSGGAPGPHRPRRTTPAAALHRCPARPDRPSGRTQAGGPHWQPVRSRGPPRSPDEGGQGGHSDYAAGSGPARTGPAGAFPPSPRTHPAGRRDNSFHSAST